MYVGGGLDETPNSRLSSQITDSFTWRLETPSISNSRGSRIVQISGIGITAGKFQVHNSPSNRLISLHTDSLTESNETPLPYIPAVLE